MSTLEKQEQFKHSLAQLEVWNQRTDQENTETNFKFLSQWVVPADQIALHHLWAFSHTPKTAGTSFDRFLAQFFQLKDILHINAPDLNTLPQVVHLKNQFPKLISGHHPIHGLLYQLLPPRPLVHLGLMRKPIDRVVSYYNYISTRDYHALNKRVKDMSFDEFLELKDLPELRNGQSRRWAGMLHCMNSISDNELYHRAKDVVDNGFTLVGVTEQLQDFCKYLSRKVKIKGHEIARINSSEIKIQLKDLTVAQRMRIESNNKVDIQLYEYVHSRFKSKIKT